MFKNLEYEKIIVLDQEVMCNQGQISSKVILQNSNINSSLFAITKGEGLSEHTASGDALIIIWEGKLEMKTNSQTVTLLQNNAFLLPAKLPHSVVAIEDTKFILLIDLEKNNGS